jgi:hypothetical protein
MYNTRTAFAQMHAEVQCSAVAISKGAARSSLSTARQDSTSREGYGLPVLYKRTEGGR